MTEKKWTPGPWVITGQPNKVCADGYTKNGCAKVVASTNEASWLGNVEPYANAHLIAAAPDLYDALDELRGAIMAVLEGKPFRCLDETMIRTDKALAKALGEK